MADQSKKLPDINFGALGRALLARAADLVAQWLPGGTRKGDEYVCGSLAGGSGNSCSVNLTTGAWADFAGDDRDRGGDLISLYAAIHMLDNGQAALQLARSEGLEDVAGIVARKGGEAPPPPARPPAPAPRPKESEKWTTVIPVPAIAPQPTFWHYERKVEDIIHKAAYYVGEHLLGFVVRFRTSGGGKETLPYTWCTSSRDGGSKWHWRQWDVPRPLYYPGRQHPEARTVILVEGEIKAEVLQALLDQHAPGVYCVVSWPGGSKAWKKASWAYLKGCTVVLWPDCDAKRELPTPKERQACADDAALEELKASKPLLPARKQPGMSAMLGIGVHLRDAHQAAVSILPIPEPGEVEDGWDCRDAIEVDGWDGTRVLEFFARAQPLPDLVDDTPSPASPPIDGKAPANGGGDEEAAGDGGDDAFQGYLDFICKQAKCKTWELGVNRHMVIAALRKAPALAGVVGYDDLRSTPSTQRPWPWRQDAAPMTDADDLRLGDWLTQKYRIKAASRGALSEAIETVADENHFHPFRDWVQAQKWDEKPRTRKWLIHVLGRAVAALPEKERIYLELVGHFILLGHVARVMRPGCKFDYSIVLEGKTGMGKSTLPETLVGEAFFSDTHFDIGAGKDGFEQLSGIIAYELSEMTAFRRADSESVKQFFSTRKDRYRGAYGRYVTDHPRQCVIWCTTNKRQYLYDLTGNRRFWPVWVYQPLNIEWLRKWRGQLFAEALVMLQAGERIFPTHEEERLYFKPEQEKRLVETSVQSKLYDLLTREGAARTEGRLTSELSQHTTFVTIAQMTAALGADPAKSTALLETQIRDWLVENGWQRARAGKPAAPGGSRPWGYARPEVWPPVDEEEESGGNGPSGNDDERGDPPAPVDDPYGGRDDAPF
ncbi:VapE domain-containing protein [Variovorax sp. 375MFSha3.1]|uniref:VapE domain-containing protein n=1 Tax=Variovorax sp. 375MFSha3.1 TaxID=3158364 RepID=UPI003AAF1BD2